MKLNIHEATHITMSEEVSGDSKWRKLIIRTDSLAKPETFEINIFWKRGSVTIFDTVIKPLTTTQTIQA